MSSSLGDRRIIVVRPPVAPVPPLPRASRTSSRLQYAVLLGLVLLSVGLGVWTGVTAHPGSVAPPALPPA